MRNFSPPISPTFSKYVSNRDFILMVLNHYTVDKFNPSIVLETSKWQGACWLRIFVLTERGYRLLRRRMIITPKQIKKLETYFGIEWNLSPLHPYSKIASFYFSQIVGPPPLVTRKEVLSMIKKSFDLEGYFEAENGNPIRLHYKYCDKAREQYSRGKLLWKAQGELIPIFTLDGKKKGTKILYPWW